MSDYTKIKLQSDTRGRVNIMAVDDEGLGHGHRLAGPKNIDGGGETITDVELDGYDIRGLWEYVGIFYEIHLSGKVPPALLTMVDDLRRYLGTLESCLKDPELSQRPHNVDRIARDRAVFMRSLMGAAVAMTLPSTAVCGCGAPILWAKTAEGKAMPVNVEPVDTGNVALLPTSPPRATVLKASERYEGPRFVSHFASCPDADLHRRRGKARA